ncbi:3-oxoadipate enol-lactonase 2 [Corynebacterium capitovis DSM 44611]|uniref:alpha/beta fold hydrolase n=1 Tax=Corynebacterium capitovis TaxID=131081 RepID=UPI00037B0736|nr:alpha/beta fold hydrolase [Corynebacterium capitovis]WKD57170.1 3-oxoadipate enol-lactonase 2 [Corynebacterium capitovis DSM 44611]
MPPTILHAAEFGPADSAQTVVLLSSIATTHEAWAKQIPVLERDYRVIALDHLGHGQSPRSDAEPGQTTIDDLAANVLATLDTLDVDRFTLVGLSLGGAIALYLSATSPRVERAVFCSTATFLGGEQRWRERTTMARNGGMSELADGMVTSWFTDGYRYTHTDAVDAVREMILGIDPEGYAQNGDALAHWDFASRLGDITCPVLTIAGESDRTSGPDKLAQIADGVSGRAEKVVVKPGSHQSALENPDDFNAALTAFLAG